MKIAFFNTKSYDKRFFTAANTFEHHIEYLEPPLNATTYKLAAGFPVVCVFVNDHLDRQTLNNLKDNGTQLIALRCAGFNNVDVAAAKELGLTIVRVPAYSPHGVAEHAVALILALNRKIYRSQSRIREGNFALEGLMGFELNDKTIGVMGTGKIGAILIKIMSGFGCKILAYDVKPNPECLSLGAQYVSKEDIYRNCDIISLHLPLLPETHHVINKESLSCMKKGVMIINTSRGGLIDSRCLIEGLKTGQIGYLGLDVYEEEESLFFKDLSGQVIQDDIFARLLTFPNVLVTGHQAFFTDTALTNIAQTTISNINNFATGNINPIHIVN